MGFWAKLLGRGKREYEAAKPSNIAGGFTVFGGGRSSNEDIRWGLKGLIAHSRKQAQNNDYLNAYFGIVRRNIVGPQGVKLQNEARNGNGELDKPANDLIEVAWDRWGAKGSPTLDGELSWRGLEEMVVSTVARDGTMLLRQFRGAPYGPSGFQVQPLEIDFLDIEMNQELRGGSSVRMGIEIDGNSRRVAYHLFTRHPGEKLMGRARDRIRVPADQMLCIFRPDRPGQLLGVPWAHSALRRLNMLKGYEEAAITAARVGAAKMGFVQKTSGDEDLDPDLLDKQATTATGHLIKEMEPGMIEQLPVGYEYKEHNPAYPTEQFKPFMQAILQGAAAGLDVSYVTLANDLSGANFSTLRAGKGEERDEWRCLQGWIVEQLHQPVFANWLSLALLMGAVGNLPVTKLDKFLQPRWRPRGWAYVSPGEEANANQREMAAMIRSPQQIVAERGEDLETVFSEIAAAQALAATYGLTFNPQPPGHEAGPPAEPPPPAP